MKKLLTLLCACALTLAAQTFDEVYKEGITNIRQGKRPEALAFFQQAAELASNSTQKTNALLQITHAMQRNEAQSALDMLVKYRAEAGKLPKMMEAFLELRIGVLQAQLKQYPEALKTLNYALSVAKLSERDQMLAYDHISNAQLHSKEYEGALKTLLKWEELNGVTANDYCRLLTRRAAIYGIQKQFAEAYAAGTEAANLDGVSKLNKGLAWQMLAHIAFANEKNPEKALEYSEKSKAVTNGKVGFNADLHAKILKACGK